MRPLRRGWILGLLLIALSATARAGDEYSFDAAEIKKKAFEIGGYLELKPDHSWLNRDGAFYKLNFYDRSPRETLDRAAATLKLNGKYTKSDFTFNFRGDVEARRDQLASDRIKRFDEAYVSYKPDPGFTLDAGKVALKWGKGYAWSPVGFGERAKDPNDVELAREGYTVVAADFIRNFDGDLKTVAFTPLLLPVASQVNNDFGKNGHINPAAKLYFLYRDTDIDIMYLGRGSRTPRVGVDFSRNLTSAMEVHGEWARIRDFEQRIVGPAGTVATQRADVTSYLLGARYLSQKDTTYILEYYRNGNVKLGVAAWMSLGVLMGTFFGAYLANQLPRETLKLVFGFVLIYVAAYTVFGKEHLTRTVVLAAVVTVLAVGAFALTKWIDGPRATAQTATPAQNKSPGT